MGWEVFLIHALGEGLAAEDDGAQCCGTAVGWLRVTVAPAPVSAHPSSAFFVVLLLFPLLSFVTRFVFPVGGRGGLGAPRGVLGGLACGASAARTTGLPCSPVLSRGAQVVASAGPPDCCLGSRGGSVRCGSPGQVLSPSSSPLWPCPHPWSLSW